MPPLQLAALPRSLTVPSVDEPVWYRLPGPYPQNVGDRRVVRIDGHQILVLRTETGLLAVANRCPHEGYPLSEGTLNGCRLTCNWHAWIFDLDSGETLTGGDGLRRYPLRVDGDDALSVAITTPPKEERQAVALAGLQAAVQDHDVERIAREWARYGAAEGDLRPALIALLDQTRDGMEYGSTHAQGVIPDWLWIHDRLPEGSADRLAPLTEIAGYLGEQALLAGGRFPFPDAAADAFDATLYAAAIEEMDEATAQAQALAGLQEGGIERLRPSLAGASVAHYIGFGHGPIFTLKSLQLAERLGPAAERGLAQMITRYLIRARREDLLPEFRGYAPSLTGWDAGGGTLPESRDLARMGVNAALPAISTAGGEIEALYHRVLHAIALQYLHFDGPRREKIDQPVAKNVDWLDFTHGVTHLNAVRHLASRDPSLWPAGLLQSGCFIGRNVGFVNWDQDVSRWTVEDPEAFLEQTLERLLDHGEPAYILSSHLVKITLAVREEWQRAPDAAWVGPLFAAVNRMFNEPWKRNHLRRTAHQAHAFVALGD